jgi:hypothetical protein
VGTSNQIGGYPRLTSAELAGISPFGITAIRDLVTSHDINEISMIMPKSYPLCRQSHENEFSEFSEFLRPASFASVKILPSPSIFHSNRLPTFTFLYLSREGLNF